MISSSANIASHLPVLARQEPYRPAVWFPHGRDRAGRVSYTHFTFQQLDEESDRLARGLHAVGITPGTRTVLMVPPSLEFFALTFALFKAGAVPVLVDPGMGIRNLGQCLAEAQPEAFIGVPKAHVARTVLGWARPTLRVLVTVGRRLLWGGYTLDRVRDLGQTDGSGEPTHVATNDDMAAILFTSGSTGIPKGVVYTHAIFQAQVALLRDTFQIQPGEIDLATFPLFALFAPALGMTAVIPDMDATRPARVDPRKIIEAVADFGVTNLFGSPALLNPIARYGEKHQVRLPSLKRVISAGAPVSAAVIERFTRLLRPGMQVHTPYGATESLPVATIGSDEILGETRHETARGSGVCVGRPVANMDVKIIRISDEPIEAWRDDLELPSGAIGEILVKGPVVTRSYFNRPASTSLAKIDDPLHGGFYHRMGDVGCRDALGRLWMCGRKSHRVETERGPMFTVCCEGIFNAHPAVYRTALVGVPDKSREPRVESQDFVSTFAPPFSPLLPVLCVELLPEARTLNRAKIRAELLVLGAAHEQTQPIVTILFHPAFPVDIRHNAKIFREKLAVWAARKLS